MRHGRRHRRVVLGDQGVHPVRDRAVGRMALAAGAELDQVHRLACVEVEHVADPVAEAERVRRRGGEPGGREPVVLRGGAVERGAVGVALAGRDDLLRHAGAEGRRERLPLHGQHAVALEVAERAVVRHDLEAVAQRLEAAAGTVAAVPALARQVAQQRRPLLRRRAPRRRRACAPRRCPRPRTGAPRAADPRRRRRARARPRAARRRDRRPAGRAGPPSARRRPGARPDSPPRHRRDRAARRARRSSA